MTPTHHSPEPQLEFPYVTIGVLTALEVEYSACLDIFDPERQGVERQKRATSGTLTCWLCFIPAKHGGKHVVAITRLPYMGNTAAAIAANILLQHCEAIESLIMCGIAGAVPHPAKPENHVRLGDIVVSGPSGIIQYDFGKQRDPLRARDDPFNGFEFRGPPRSPCPELLAGVGNMHADERLLGRGDLREWEKKIVAFLSRVRNAPSWKRPALTKDRLIDTPDGTGDPVGHPKDPERRHRKPRVFRGAIGAANIVLADPKKRDALRDRWDIRAVEMEGSGVADASWVAKVGHLVVRGTCDYCNSTKNDDWHSYAALIAAAYTRTVIEYLHPHALQERETFPAVQAIPTTAGPASLEAPAVPPRIDASKLSTGAAESSTIQGAQAEPVKHRASPAVVLETGGPRDVAVLPVLDLASTVAPEPQLPSLEHRRIQELNERLDVLLESGRSKDAAPPAFELEKLLRRVPPRGAIVREGWLILARLEAARLRAEKKPGETPDVTRLQQLRKEAESVTD